MPGLLARSLGWGREIVAKRVGILSALGIVLSLLVQLDVIPLDWSVQVTAWVTAGIGALVALAAIQWTRAGVTPADPLLAPVSSNGVPLIEAVTPDSVAARLLARDLDDTTPAKHDARK